MPEGRVVLGRVIGAHGVRGHVRIRCLGDGPDSLLAAGDVWLAENESESGAHYEVSERGTARAGEVRLLLAGIADRDAAQALRGLLVLADASLLEPLPDGEFYWQEVVGCAVEASDGTPVGRVVEIWETGAHDVLVVETDTGDRVLLPTARELMPEIDVAGRRIVVEALPGLLDPV